jgi:hypothetical protein
LETLIIVEESITILLGENSDMITFENTHDIFGFVEDFHRRIKELYEQLEQKQENKRVRIILHYLKKIRSLYENGLAYYRKNKVPTKIDVWFQYVPNIETLTINELSIKDLETATNLSLKDIVSIDLELDNRLIDFYRKLSENVNIPGDIKDVFGRLAEQESQEKAELMKLAEDIEQM